MDKEELLLKNFTVLSKNPIKNRSGLKSTLKQLIELNPAVGLRCWEECIRNNIEEIEKTDDEYEYNSVGYVLLTNMEYEICKENSFSNAVNDFAKNKFLLEKLYTKATNTDFFSASYVISYLIRTDNLQNADNVLSALYKNKKFNEYADFWEEVIDMFEYGDKYNPSVYCDAGHKQPEHIRDFCISWIERIKDEEEQASAMSFAMQMF